jgi:hypothetical protein
VRLKVSDILVPIPKDQLAHFRNDKMDYGYAFWRLSSKPRQLARGDYIFFSRPEGVVASGQVLEITQKVEGSPDRSGKWNVVWAGKETRLFEPPVEDIQYAGRGFRYLKPSEQARFRRMQASD